MYQDTDMNITLAWKAVKKIYDRTWTDKGFHFISFPSGYGNLNIRIWRQGNQPGIEENIVTTSVII